MNFCKFLIKKNHNLRNKIGQMTELRYTVPTYLVQIVFILI